MINLCQDFATPLDPAKYLPGEVVRHLLYNYRGVVVEFELSCLAEETWYQSNKTQPNKNQPWYFILVDGVQKVTYVAETNLAKDTSGRTVVHGMINLFFSAYEESANKYIRNQVPWNPGNPPTSPPDTPPGYPPGLS